MFVWKGEIDFFNTNTKTTNTKKLHLYFSNILWNCDAIIGKGEGLLLFGSGSMALDKDWAKNLNSDCYTEMPIHDESNYLYMSLPNIQA